MFKRFALLAGLALLVLAGPLAAQQPPSYARQVKPFLAKYCLECHGGGKAKGGLSLEAYPALRKGGDSGPALVPGKPDESLIVRLVEGKEKKVMPPKKAKQPKPAERALLRAWIAAGAKDDAAGVRIAILDIKPKQTMPAPVAAVAYSPDGKRLAAAGNKAVSLIDVATGDVIDQLTGLAGKVTALAYSRDGRTLAVGTGKEGQAGEIHLYSVRTDGSLAETPRPVLAGHRDVILDIAWSPDNRTLATCGYDRLIKLWDAASGKELRTLKDHSDSVYGVAFSPDGRLLASAAADRAVKIWDAASGARLHTLGESTDWLYAVAWSPDGRHVAAAGVDKYVRVWEVTPAAAKLVHGVFAHEAAVTRLVYGADGKTLYSLGEDRAAKAWDTARMVEQKVYPKQPESPLALAVRPGGKQLAVGRYDGVLVLLDAASGQVQSQPLPAKPRPPLVAKIAPNFGRRGTLLRLRCEGKFLKGVTELSVNHPGVTARIIPEGKSANALSVEITFPPNTPPGVYQLSLKSSAGVGKAVPFTLDPFAAVMEGEANDSPGTGQKIALPATVVGTLGRAGDVDYFRFEAQAGQEIGVQALAGPGGTKLEPALHLSDPSGRVVAESMTGVLGHRCERAGGYVLSVRDRSYRGGGNMPYRLHVGPLPVVTAVYPLGIQRGTESLVHLDGVNLGETTSVLLKAPADAQPGSKLPVTINTSHGPPLGNSAVVVGEFPEAVRSLGRGDYVPAVPVPGTANGRIDAPGATDTWRFTARKGERLIIEVHARRLGAPLDSYLELLDAQGRPLPRATLRCLAKTYTTFLDFDSSTPGIRLEAWNELAVNDYTLIGGELARIRELPKNPDDNCQFFSVDGQRVGLLDTTPTFHSAGTPVYKVSLHPPGSTFPPNGLPVVTLFYRNDDGGPGYGKDSRLVFDPPADGEYQVRVGDANGQGGAAYAYRLTVRPPRPDFAIRFSPTGPSVWKGGAVPVTVTATRIDGFEGPIAVRLENVPPGFSAPFTNVPEGEQSTTFALWAEANATTPKGVPPLKLVARATIAGQEVVREAAGQLPKATEPGDLVTTTGQSEVTLQPGHEVRLIVRIERRKGFTGRVPVDVRGLPHGVRVLDIGLNGILIVPGETSRTIAIYAEPWVQPQEHPFVVLARREGRNAEHAAKSVLLRVVGTAAARR
jgi:WD40 repeat protein